MSIPQNGNKSLLARAKDATDTILREVNRHAPEDQSGALQQLLGDWLATTRDPILRELVLGEVARRLRLPVGSLKQLVGTGQNQDAQPYRGGPAKLYTLKELRALRERLSENAEESLPLFGLKNIIRKGRTHLFAGKPRVGKTETLFRGGVLHWHNERVLYLSEEHEDDWSIRLSSYEEEELPEHVDIWLCAGEPREALLQKIRQGSYSVVVTDTLRGIWQLRDELHPSRVVDDLSPLISLQRQLGFTLICLHHERKAEGEAITDRFAGTNALSAMFDMLISLAPKGEGGLLLTYEGRTSKGGSLLLQWKGDELCYVGEADLVEFRTLAQRVEGVIYSAGRMLTTKEVWRELGEPRPSLRHMQDILDYLLQNGRIAREPKEGGRGTTFRWHAPQTILGREGESSNYRESSFELSSNPEGESSNYRESSFELSSNPDDGASGGTSMASPPSTEKVRTAPLYSSNFLRSAEHSEEDPFAQADGFGLLAYDPVSGHWYPTGRGGTR